MTEWIKKMCDIPINYGLKHINYLISNAIQIFLNTYGDKLFNLNDITIEKNECKNDENLFYLRPITLKESVQHIGLNTINLKTGNLTGIIISTPSISQYTRHSTKVTVEHINLTIEFIDASNSLMITTLTAESFNNDNNINDIFIGIKKIILQYLNAICCEIQTVTINVLNKITIMMIDIFFDNDKFICREINISRGITIVRIENFKFVSEKNNFLSIDLMHINSNIIEFLPEIYLENAAEEMTLSVCTINKIVIDDIEINNIEIIMSTNEIIVSKIKSIIFDSLPIFYDQSNGNIATFEKNTKICKFDKYLTLTIHDASAFKSTINQIFTLLNNLSLKIIIANDDNVDNHFNFKNINLTVISDPHMVDIIIDDIHVATDIIVCNLQVKYENVILKCQKIQYDQIISCYNLTFCSFDDEFSLISKKLNIDGPNIIFSGASAINLLAIISFITNIITICQSKFPTVSESNINIHINESNITHKYLDSEIKIIIHNGNINLTEKNITDAKLDIILDTYLVANIIINQISQTSNDIDAIKIYIDPEIFDKINNLFGILNDTVDEDKNKISQIMSQTLSANNAQEFESYIQKMLAENDNSLINSFSNLCAIIINDYNIGKFDEIYSANIPSVHIYLFDELKKNIYEISSAFISIVIKNVNINTYQKNVDDISYEIGVQSFTIIDMLCNNPKNKYFLKNTYENDTTLSIVVDVAGNIDNTVKIQIDIHPLTFNINEETLIRLLSFFSNSYKCPQQKKSTNIINFCMKGLILTVNYYPIASQYLNHDMLSLQDCKLLLSSQKIMNANGLDDLYATFINNLKTELNLFNMVQFIPNIKIIQPLTSPIGYIYQVINKYFSNQHNKKKLRGIIKNISAGTTFASVLIQKGIYQILDIFS